MFIRQSTSTRCSAAFMVATLVALSACGGSDASTATGATAVPVDSLATADGPTDSDVPAARPDAPTYTIAAGDTLSGIAGRANVSLDELIAANEWADGLDHLITPGDVIQLPDGAEVSTPAITAGGGGNGDATAAGRAEYGPMATTIEFTGGRTAPVVTPLADGLYYAGTASASGGQVTLTLGQWFTCDDGVLAEHPTLDCVSGFGTLEDPSAKVKVAANAVVTVNVGDLDTSAKVGISAAEFARLVSGQAPAASAPDGYSYIPYLLFVQVQNGVAVEVEQVYTS